MAQSTTVERAGCEETASEAVVSAVTELTGADPKTIEPLYSAVDPDALDALFAADRDGEDRSSCRVAFTYCGCDVVVSGDGAVRVSRQQEVNSTGTYDVRS